MNFDCPKKWEWDYAQVETRGATNALIQGQAAHKMMAQHFAGRKPLFIPEGSIVQFVGVSSSAARNRMFCGVRAVFIKPDGDWLVPTYKVRLPSGGVEEWFSWEIEVVPDLALLAEEAA